MIDTSLVDIGASAIEPTNSALTVQAGNVEDEEFQAYEALAVFGQLGLIARPAPAGATSSESCQGITIDTPIDTTVVAMRDVRTLDAGADLAEGDVVLHSVGPAHTTRVFLREASDTVEIQATAVTMSGTLDVVGNVTWGGDLELTGNATLGGELAVETSITVGGSSDAVAGAPAVDQLFTTLKSAIAAGLTAVGAGPAANGATGASTFNGAFNPTSVAVSNLFSS